MKISAYFVGALVASALIGACGSDAKTTIDAAPTVDSKVIDAPVAIADAPANMSTCPVPGNVPAMITISGTGRQVSGFSIGTAPDVTVEAFRGNSTTPETTTTTAADGKYSLMFATNGMGVDGSIRGKKATFLDSYLYPGVKLYADVSSAPVLMLKQGDIDLIAQLSGASPLAPNTNFVGVAVQDCMGNNVANAVITTVPATKVRYNGSNGLPSNSGTKTSTDGVAFIFEAPAGTLQITATVNGMSYPVRSVPVIAGTTAATVLTP
ncbi:MAG TPA: hypothetical protein PLF40_24795 [Kofleriaceae bacterium]|nr:hypothetical protein [Kofleriaceae bacterium]